MAKTEAEEKAANETKSSPKKQMVSEYPSYSYEENHNRKSFESRFQNIPQKAVEGTENTITTVPEKYYTEKLYAVNLYLREKR